MPAVVSPTGIFRWLTGIACVCSIIAQWVVWHPFLSPQMASTMNNTQRLSAVDRKRLASLLGMLGSNAAGERDNAARLAEQFRREHGLSWADLLTPMPEPIPQPQPPPPPSSPPKPPAKHNRHISFLVLILVIVTGRLSSIHAREPSKPVVLSTSVAPAAMHAPLLPAAAPASSGRSRTYPEKSHAG
jgi:hypothetical protein